MDMDEGARLRALYTYAVLDTPPEPNFDRITSLAASIFGMPVCVLGFADAIGTGSSRTTAWRPWRCPGGCRTVTKR